MAICSICNLSTVRRPRCPGHTTTGKRAVKPTTAVRSYQTKGMTGFGSKGKPTKKGK